MTRERAFLQARDNHRGLHDQLRRARCVAQPQCSVQLLLIPASASASYWPCSCSCTARHLTASSAACLTERATPGVPTLVSLAHSSSPWQSLQPLSSCPATLAVLSNSGTAAPHHCKPTLDTAQPREPLS